MSKKYKMTTKDIEIIQEFVDNINYTNVDYIHINRGDRYEVDIADSEIYLGSKRYSRVNAWFDEWTTKVFNETFNHVAICLLHEVGHIITFLEEEQEQRDLLEFGYSNSEARGDITLKEHNQAYFGFPCEFQATEWAVDYYRTHPQEIKELLEKLNCC